MNLKHIKALSHSIKAKQEEIDLALKERSRCQKAITAADQNQGEINSLLREGAEAKAKAFLSRTEADTSQIEARIEELETQNSENLHQGCVARDALALLDQSLEKLHGDLANLEAAQLDHAEYALKEAYEKAKCLYTKALDDMRSSIEMILAVASVHDTLLSKATRMYPGAYLYVITNRDQNLSGGADKAHQAPGWLSEQNLENEIREKLISDLESSGFSRKTTNPMTVETENV